MKEEHILITNIRYVTVNGVRVHANALLLSRGRDWLGGSDKAQRLGLRAFGADPVWETMDMPVPSIEFTVEEGKKSRAIMVTDSEPEGRPLFTAATIQIANGGPRLDIMHSSDRDGLKIETFATIVEVWHALPRRVEEFWNAPYIPTVGNRPAFSGRR